jgi:hypothetical protein
MYIYWIEGGLILWSILRFIITVFNARYITKLIQINETNDVGGEYTRTLLISIFCKEYLRF